MQILTTKDMKNIIYALAIFCTLHIAAQEGTDHTDRMDRKEMRKEKGKEFMKDLSPEQMAQLQTKRMTLALDLTEKQQKRVLVLHTEAAKARKQQMEIRKAKKEKNEKPTDEEKYAMMSAHLDAKIAFKKSMKEILTAEQYAKWEKMHAHKDKRKRGKKEMHEDKK